MIKRLTILVLAVLASAIATSADAQHRRTSRQQTTITCNERGCSDYAQAQRARTAAVADTAAVGDAGRSINSIDANGNTVVIGGRPAGCPRQFCGCEASRYVFGRIRPELNLASNWIKYFPRAEPAPGMAAARGGHVMVLIGHVSGNDWLVHDGNSGGGLTRRHVRSIRGYVTVNPHAARAAEQQPARAAANAPPDATN